MNILKKYITKSNISCQEFANRFNDFILAKEKYNPHFTRNTIHNWEKGTLIPRVQHISQLADFFDTVEETVWGSFFRNLKIKEKKDNQEQDTKVLPQEKL